MNMQFMKYRSLKPLMEIGKMIRQIVLKLKEAPKMHEAELLIHLFARDLFLMKKLEIEKAKTTFIISVFKVVYHVVLVLSISNFFTNKTSLANKWMSFSSNNLALVFCCISKYVPYACHYNPLLNTNHT